MCTELKSFMATIDGPVVAKTFINSALLSFTAPVRRRYWNAISS